MKKLFYLMLVVLGTAAFTACSDDDDNDNGGGNSNDGNGIITIMVEENVQFSWIGTSIPGEVITIDWGDGTTEDIVSVKDETEDETYSNCLADLNHEYTENGAHTITITGKNIIEFGWESGTVYSIDMSKCYGIESLYCTAQRGNSHLMKLNLDGCNDLKSLEINGDLTSLDISDCIALRYVDLQGEFTAEEMNKIYNALPAVESGTLACDELGDWSIAEKKGWTVELY